MTIKNQIILIKKGLVGAESVGTFTRKNQTNCDDLATLEFILSKYKKYNDVFEEYEKSFCYDLGLTGRFAGNFCQNLNLAIWANVGNVWNVGNVPDVSDVPRRS